MAKQKDDFSRQIDKLTNSILASIDHAPTSSTPVGMEEVSKEEQIQDYIVMRNDPEAWTKLLGEHGLKDTLRYARDMEKAIREPDKEVENATSTDNEG